MATDRQAQTDTDGKEYIYEELAYKIIGLAIEVRQKLGLGFLEKVYENALMVLLKRETIKCGQQYPIDVLFEGQKVGHYVADIIVEDKIIIEIKAAEQIANEHRAQALNYLKATGLRLAIIMNFGPKDFTFERIIL